MACRSWKLIHRSPGSRGMGRIHGLSLFFMTAVLGVCDNIDRSVVADSASNNIERTVGFPGPPRVPKQTHWRRLGRRGHGTLFDLAKWWSPSGGHLFIRRSIAINKHLHLCTPTVSKHLHRGPVTHSTASNKSSRSPELYM